MIKKAVLIFTVVLFGLSAYAADPVIFFSDMTDGPVSGWEGSSTKGAAVTVYGINLGSTRGTSYVTVANSNASTSVDLTTAGDYGEWGATTNPTTPTFNGVDQLQRITFYLNSSMGTSGSGPNSTITVTTSEGTSSALDFHCRSTGDIYFVALTGGSDAYNGEYASFDSGSDGPWATIDHMRDTLSAGDVAYIGAGTWTAYDAGGYDTSSVLQFYNGNQNNGASYDSITVKAYPGAAVTWGNGSVQALSTAGSNPATNIIHYWTFSNMAWIGPVNAVSFTKYNYEQTSSHMRFIGLDGTTLGGGGKTIFTFVSGDSQTYIYLYGCYLHDAGVTNRGDADPTTKGYGFSMSGGYADADSVGHDYIYIGWNESCHHRYGHAFYIFGHFSNDNGDQIDNLYIHDNWFHHNSLRGTIIGGGDNNGSGGAYAFVEDAWYYNNVISDNDESGAEFGGSAADSAGDGGNIRVYNNTFYNNGHCYELYGGSSITATITLINNICYDSNGWVHANDCGGEATCSGSNNLWYDSGSHGDSVPSWSSSNQTTDPSFSDAANDDFTLSSESSPAVDNGSASVSSVVVNDVRGLSYSGGTYEIGAFLYGAEASSAEPTIKCSINN